MQAHAVHKHHGLLRCACVLRRNIQRSNLRGRKSGCCASGRMERKSLQSSIFRLCHRVPRSTSSYVWQNYDGESNVTTKNSSRRSGSTTGRVATGEAFIITSRYALSLTPSSSFAGRFSPRSCREKWTLPVVRAVLQQVLVRRIGRCPCCRQTLDPATPPRGPSKM